MSQINVMMGKVGFGFSETELISLGLGSCVGVLLYEPGKKLAALGHVVLPHSSENRIELENSKIIMSLPEKSRQDIMFNALKDEEYKIIFESDDVLRKVQLEKPALALLDNKTRRDVLVNMTESYPSTKVMMLCDSFNKNIFLDLIKLGAKEVMFAPYLKERISLLTKVNIHETTLKYANVMIPYMIEKLVMMGVNRNKIIAKISGGSQMFANIDVEDLMIGKRNVNKIKEELSKYNIKIISEDTGGSVGRTVRFNVNTQKFTIKTKNKISEI